MHSRDGSDLQLQISMVGAEVLWGSILLFSFRSHSKKLSLEAVSSVFPMILKSIAAQSNEQSPKPKRFYALVAEVDYVLCNQVLENHLTILIQTSDFTIHVYIIDNLGSWENELLPTSCCGGSSLHKVLTTKRVVP